MADSIKIFASATVANVTCGFDIMGFAVDEPGDEVILKKRDEPGVTITSIEGDNGRLPLDPKKNTAGIVVHNFLKSIDYKGGIEIALKKKMPFGSGLGSSAASAVASIYAINELLDKPNKVEDLLPFAMEGERIACGTAHADNVAPSLLGGFVVVRSYDPLDVIRIPIPNDLYCTIIHPDIEVETKDARNILKKGIQLSQAVAQWGNVAGLITGLIQSDYDLISRSMQDVIIEPVRSLLIPGFDHVKNAALEARALGAGISGSGPSVFALSKGRSIAEEVGEAMKSAFSKNTISSDVFVSKINKIGPRVVQD